MPDIINIKPEGNHIEVKSYDVVTKEDIEASIAKVIQINVDTGINRILVDTTSQKVMPENMHVFNLFSTFPKELRLALLVNNDQDTLKSLHFVEAITYKVSPNVLIFFDRVKAIKWLESI